MTELCPINALAQKWHLAYFVLIVGHFDQWLENRDMNFKFVLTSIHINVDIQTKFEVNQNQIDILSQKTPKTHQSDHILKLHFSQVPFTKKPTSPTFSMNFSETFRINVNIDFAHINHGQFLI